MTPATAAKLVDEGAQHVRQRLALVNKQSLATTRVLKERCVLHVSTGMIRKHRKKDVEEQIGEPFFWLVIGTVIPRKPSVITDTARSNFLRLAACAIRYYTMSVS